MSHSDPVQVSNEISMGRMIEFAKTMNANDWVMSPDTELESELMLLNHIYTQILRH